MVMGQERVSFLFAHIKMGRSNSMHDDRNNLVRREQNGVGEKNYYSYTHRQETIYRQSPKSTGNSTQHSEMTHIRKESKKE